MPPRRTMGMRRTDDHVPVGIEIPVHPLQSFRDFPHHRVEDRPEITIHENDPLIGKRIDDDKGPGPLTIMDCTADAHYGDERRLGAALADALNHEILALAAAGCQRPAPQGDTEALALLQYDVSSGDGTWLMNQAYETPLTFAAGAQVAITGVSCRQQVEHGTGARPLHLAEFLAAQLPEEQIHDPARCRFSHVR